MLINFFLMTIILFSIILGISLLSKKKSNKLPYIIPLVGSGCGLLFIGYIIFSTAETDFSQSMCAFSLFISSALTFIIIAMIDNMKQLKNHFLSK